MIPQQRQALSVACNSNLTFIQVYMTKKKILLLLPLLLIGGILIYTWTIILFTEVDATWRQYLALLLFPFLLLLFFKNFTKAILATILYLLVGTCNLLTLTTSVNLNSYGLRILTLEIWTPTFQLLSFGLLVLFCICNLDALIDMHLDYKESREAKTKL